MHATFIDLLPGTKTSAHNELTWQPSATTRNAGLLTLDVGRARVTYLVVETAGSYPTRNFLFAKSDGTPGSDRTESAYTVSVGVAGSPMACECKGFIYGRGKPCKHISAALCLIENGWLDRDQTNPDADTASTECPF